MTISKVDGTDFLSELIEKNRQRQVEWDTTDGGVCMLFRMVELSGEVGELANKIKKEHRSKIGLVGSKSNIEEVKDEMGDVLISLVLLAEDLGVNLAEATKAKFNKTSVKYGFNTKF